MKASVRQTSLFIILFIIIALIMQVIVFDNILFSVYKWHLKQPETIEGGILILIILLSYILINRFVNKKYSLLLGSLITILYFLNTNLLLPVLVSILYFEAVFSIGSYVNKKFYTKMNEDKLLFYLRSFLIGFVIWSFVNLILSILGFGTINNIRVSTLILFLLSIQKGFNKPFSIFLIQKLKGFSKKEKDIISLLVVLVLVLFSKSNRAIDYDSIWYGLRPEYVLVGEKSFFENLGLVQFVHFYPKLFEFFTLPLGNLDDYSFIYSLNIIFYILSLIVIYKFLNLLISDSLKSLIGTLMLATIPAFANISVTAKPDIFSIFFILFGVLQLMYLILKGQSENLFFGFSALIIALGGKSTSFLYIPFIVLGFVLTLIIINKNSKNQYFEMSKYNILKMSKSTLFLLLFALINFVFICYRTYKLTGYPVYPSGLSIWNKLGFSAKYPVMSAHDVDGLDFSFTLVGILERWYKLLFNPQDYGHVIMLWTGNLVFFLVIVFILWLVFGKCKTIEKNSLLLQIMFLPIILVGIFFATFMRNGGDGNYFILPIVFGFICVFTLINLNINKPNISKWINIGILIFLPFQGILTFISHSSWQWGTQEFSKNLSIYNSESNADLLEVSGLTAIEEYIKDSKKVTRTIGFGDEQLLNHLSTRFENITGIASDHLGNSNIVATEKNFIEYLSWANIDFIILPKQEILGFNIVKNVIKMIEQESTTVKIETAQYILLDIREVNINNLNQFILNEGWYDDEGGYRWINKNATVTGKSGDIGEFLLEGLVPNQYEKISISLVINGNNVVTEEFKPGKFKIKHPVEKNKVMKIQIKTDKSFVPKEKGQSEDLRELSIVINKVEIK